MTADTSAFPLLRLAALTLAGALAVACSDNALPPTSPRPVGEKLSPPLSEVSDPPKTLDEADSRRAEIVLPSLEGLEPIFAVVVSTDGASSQEKVLSAAWPKLSRTSPSPALQGVTYQQTTVTWAEFRLLVDWPQFYQPTKKAAEDALNEANRQWPGMDPTDTKLDAFRHAYWNILLSKRISLRSWAERYTTAHESETSDGGARRMDLSNNLVGRSLYSLAPWMSEADQSSRLKNFRYVFVPLIGVNQTFGYLVYIK